VSKGNWQMVLALIAVLAALVVVMAVTLRRPAAGWDAYSPPDDAEGPGVTQWQDDDTGGRSR